MREFAPVRPPRSAKDLNFLQEVERGEHWVGPKTVSIKGAKVATIRAVYAVFVGHAPAGVPVITTCGVDDCLNPQRLALSVVEKPKLRVLPTGKAKAHRASRGTSSPTDEQVAEMHDLYMNHSLSQADIGNLFGLSQSRVSKLFRHRGLEVRALPDAMRVWWRHQKMLVDETTATIATSGANPRAGR